MHNFLKIYYFIDKFNRQEIIKLNPGDRINVPEFNDENGVVEKTSNNDFDLLTLK